MDNPDWYFFIVRLFSEGLSAIAVPLFFIFSGFLFFYGKKFSGVVYRQKLRTRVRTLLVPFFLWNILAILWRLKSFLPVFSSFYQPTELHISLVRLFCTFFCNIDNSGIIVVRGISPLAPTAVSPIDAPLWYVRDLMIMVIFSPLLFWLIKKCNYWFVVGCALCWFLSSLFLPNGSYISLYAKQLFTALFFFAWGTFFSVNKKNLVISFRRLHYLPIVYIAIVIADMLTKEMAYNVYIHKLGILCGVISTVAIAAYLLDSGKLAVNQTLADSSFFVFAFHFLFIRELGKFTFFVLHIPENNPYAMLTLYFAVPILSLIICVSLYLLLKRYTPRICGVLTGGR